MVTQVLLMIIFLLSFLILFALCALWMWIITRDYSKLPSRLKDRLYQGEL